MKFTSTLLRLLFSIVVGVALIAVIPIYGEPFGGCATRGFGTLELGCTLWLDVLRGFGFVFFIACIGPNRWRSQFWGLAIVMIVASLGGLSAMKSGVHLGILSNPASMFFYWRGTSLAIFLGGLLGVGSYYLMLYFRSWRSNK